MTPCWYCGAERESGKNAWAGLCKTDYRRWADHGYPAAGPPPPRSGVGAKAGLADRIEDYAWLRNEQRLSRTEAAIRLGVCRRTADRYEAALRETTAA